MVQDRAIVTMAEQQKVVNGLSNGTIFNELERPLPQFSRSRYSLTLDISQTAKDTVIVARQVRLGLFDMSAVLDFVDHSILLQRLEKNCGVTSLALQWMTSFLTDQTQQVAT